MIKNLFILLFAFLAPANVLAQFAVGGDARVNPEDFLLSIFADSLNFPVGMFEMEDGSLLVGLSTGSFLASNEGRIIRLRDLDGDGVSDQKELVLDEIPIGKMSDLQVEDDLLVVTGQGGAIIIYKHENNNEALSLLEVGQINIAYPEFWLHPHNTLALRKVENSSVFEIFTNIGSDVNWEQSSRIPNYTTSFGISGDLIGDSIYRFSFKWDGQSLSQGQVDQIASGLRSASGIAFEPESGDMYFQDNGIDGVADPNEPVSADEINVIPKSDIGGAIEYFGFPSNYTEYRSDLSVGGEGTPPLVAFQPFGSAIDGFESEGANDILFAPKTFPDGLNDGLFVGFHGKFLEGGLNNEENPIVYVDLIDNTYFHFVSNMESGVGHLDGLALSDSAIYIADISRFGSLGLNQQNTGRIYMLKYRSGISTSNSSELPLKNVLSVPYPNPFSGSITFEFNLERNLNREVGISIVDPLGRLIISDKVLNLSSGTSSYTWDGFDSLGRAVTPGLYLFSISGPGLSETVSIIKLTSN